MKKRIIIISIISFLSILSIILILNNNKIRIKSYNNEYYSLNYDTTWKQQKDDNVFILKHKKSKGILTIKTKILDDYYIDTGIEDIIDDILTSIMNQNKDYKLISMYENQILDNSRSYLFENNDEQVLVDICKQDDLLLITYYENNSNYYDIVLDSVETIIKSIEFHK